MVSRRTGWVLIAIGVVGFVGLLRSTDPAPLSATNPALPRGEGGAVVQTARAGPQASPIDSAVLLCRTMDSTGLASSPCTYSGWDSSITVTLDMASDEARDLCQRMSGFVSDQGLALSDWTLHIRSPYSGENSIAFCRLG